MAMSNAEQNQKLEAENAALRKQKQQLEQQLADEAWKKLRARARDCFVSAAFLFTFSFLANSLTIPFAGKPPDAEKAAMVLGSLGAVLAVAGIFLASKRR